MSSSCLASSSRRVAASKASPRSERAMGYLEGLSAAAGLGLVGTDGDTPDTEPDAAAAGTLVG